MKKYVIFTKYAIEYLNTIPSDARGKIEAIANVLEEEGRLVAPYGEKVEGQMGLFEIRTKDANGQYRVFYAYSDGIEVYLLNGFTKKTQKTPPAEIKKALKIKKEMGL
jgi:phage-related protein